VYLAPDDVQIHQAQTLLPHGALENGIGSENVYLPRLRLGNLAQPQDDAARATEARVAGDV
jgi:hypothetical protein